MNCNTTHYRANSSSVPGDPTVRPGDVVLDIGTGSGILAVAAARAGARHVYAVEAGGIAREAAVLFETSGYADRISILHGWSYAISIPEPADVLVTEMIGDDPLRERLVDVVLDARQRLLRKGARVIPAAIDVYAQAYVMPPEELEQHAFGPSAVSAWKAAYGIDLEPVRLAADRTPRRCDVNPYRARHWQAMGEPVKLFAVDFTAPEVPPRCRLDLPSGEPAPNAVLVYFDSRLGETVRLRTRPSAVAAEQHWISPVWLLPKDIPRELSFRIEARRDLHLEWPSAEGELSGEVAADALERGEGPRID